MTNVKNENRKKITSYLPIDIAHGVEEEGGAIPRVHNNTVDANVPIFVGGVELVDVSPPSRASMIALPKEKHLPHMGSEVRVVA